VEVVHGVSEVIGADGVEVRIQVDEDSVSVTGQIVVYRLMTSVVTEPIFPGQSVTSGAHDVMV
jgi:hypothetical protein